MNFIRKFFGKNTTEKIISIILPIVIAIFTGLATNFSTGENSCLTTAIIFWFITGIFSAIFIALLLLCWHFQKNEKEKDINKEKNVNSCYMDLGNRLNNYISAYLYNTPSYDIMPILTDCYICFADRDKFRHIWQNICEDIMKLVMKLKFEGEYFGVNIIIKCCDNDKTGFFMPAFKYEKRVDSRSQLSSEFKEENLFKHHYFYNYFKKDSEGKNIISTVEILRNSNEIADKFDNKNPRDYSQMITMPLKYKNYTLGVIQIIGYEKSFIFDPNIKKAELEGEINNYFLIYEKLALLTLILGLKSDKQVYINSRED